MPLRDGTRPMKTAAIYVAWILGCSMVTYCIGGVAVAIFAKMNANPSPQATLTFAAAWFVMLLAGPVIGFLAARYTTRSGPADSSTRMTPTPSTATRLANTIEFRDNRRRRLYMFQRPVVSWLRNSLFSWSARRVLPLPICSRANLPAAAAYSAVAPCRSSQTRARLQRRRERARGVFSLAYTNSIWRSGSDAGAALGLKRPGSQARPLVVNRNSPTGVSAK